MRIIIRSKEMKLWLPIPLSLASAAIHLTPEFLFAEIRKSAPPLVHDVINKNLLLEIVKECRFVLNQYKGLEIVHVEAQDGTFVSIRL